MEANITQLKKNAESEIAATATLSELEAVRLKYFGRKDGVLNMILRSLKDLDEKQRKEIGRKANELKAYLESEMRKKEKKLSRAGLSAREESERIDVTAPGTRVSSGHLHPLTQLIAKATSIFSALGFSVAQGPEVESEYYNFDALNFPKEHPARDMQDTFWLGVPGLLLRTHTSPVQIRFMEKHRPPFRFIVPGRVFRHEATDQSHEAQFYQLEAVMIDRHISLANLKAVLESFFRQLFSQRKLVVRFRPSFFPFTEPSVEVIVTCFKCGGKKCAMCGHSGWMEMGGAGMVHPNVLKNVGVNPKAWQGFAFGLGLDRVAMMQYGIDDIRLLYNGDIRFLKQF